MTGSDAGIPVGGQIALIFVLILINAYFAASEMALVSASKNKIKVLADEGDKRAVNLLKLLESPNKFLSAIQVVITLSGFFAASSAAVGLSEHLAVWFQERGIPFNISVSVGVITVIISFVTLVLGELYPKRIAMQHAERVSLAVAGSIRFFSILFKPCVWLLSVTVNGLLRITGQKTGVEEDTFDEEEVKSMLEVGQESGVLKEEGKKMIDNLFAFDDKLAYEIMTPRTDVFSIDVEATTDEYIDELMELKYSRIPAYEGDSDKIIGIIHVKDFFIKAREVGFENVKIREIMRDAYFVPETKNIDSLFLEMQKKRHHIAILIDEYGGFSGIVTMEDIVEEVMGDIDDEYDDESGKIEPLGKDTYRLDGNEDIDDVNEELGTDFESENSETIGGLIIDELGEIPVDDDELEEAGLGTEEKQKLRTVEMGRYTFTIESVKERRIETVLLHIGELQEEEDTEEGEKPGKKEEKNRRKEEKANKKEEKNGKNQVHKQ